MARDLTPIVKRSRREGVALHPKAHKIMMKRKSLPGQQPGARMAKPTQYGLQLREKQKVKRMYGLLEKQFRRIVSESERSSEITGNMILQLLERRLDNVIYRLQLAPSRQAARQLSSHGHFTVNGKRVTVPSYRVKPGDIITIRERSLKKELLSSAVSEAKDSPANVSWMTFDPSKATATITGLPQPDDADPEINIQLIVEFYSR